MRRSRMAPPVRKSRRPGTPNKLRSLLRMLSISTPILSAFDGHEGDQQGIFHLFELVIADGVVFVFHGGNECVGVADQVGVDHGCGVDWVTKISWDVLIIAHAEILCWLICKKCHEIR